MVKKLSIEGQWSNEDNAAYYENTPVEVFQDYATRGGLSDFSDLKLIHDYIFNANSLIEIGAGYGRVIDYLLENNFKGEVIAVERSKQFFKGLVNKYSKASVDILHASVDKLSLEKQVDLILWLWSGFSDFSKEEQCAVVKNLYRHLMPKGMLILEAFSHEARPLNAEDSQAQSYVIQGQDSALRGYIPSPNEMADYAKQSGFENIEHIPYKTSADRPRSLFILSK